MNAYSAEQTPAWLEMQLCLLRRRIADLKDERFELVVGSEATNGLIREMATRINCTIVDIFGEDSVEYEECAVSWDAWHSLPWGVKEPPNRWHRQMQCYAAGTEKARDRLQRATEILESQLADLARDKSAQAARAFERLAVHSDIGRAAGQLYKDGHNANAVEAACKALSLLVKRRSDCHHLDGVDLMMQVFNEKEPVLRFNDGRDKSDESEQRGMKFLFAGAIAGFRNPRAHKFIDDDPGRALECIALVSLLAKLLDDAKRV